MIFIPKKVIILLVMTFRLSEQLLLIQILIKLYSNSLLTKHIKHNINK